ncbi:MAG TPA: DUF2784 family protein, partial [Spirochaetota bacterium]|nr:DUF2784 family protein [Spirochaetota bacterium]
MNNILLHILDWFFLIFHTGLSLFNSLGWIFRKTRRIQLATISLTAASWFVLGIWYGWGFCPSTEWHWQVRDALGTPVQSDSYIHFLVLEITGLNLPAQGVDIAVLATLGVSMLLSVIL